MIEIPIWIYESLCYYDKKNPVAAPVFYEEENTEKRECTCDNCFYGRTKLAEYILNLQNISSL